MITIFTPSFADDANTNAQNLTVKEVVSRLPPDRFRVILLGDKSPDLRIAARANTEILSTASHGNTARWITRVLLSRVDIYFFPREGPLDALFLFLRRTLGLPISLVTYIVMDLSNVAVGPTMVRSIREADRIIGNSLFISQTVTRRFGVPVAGTIYDGIKRDLFYPPPENRPRGPKLMVLYAGSLQARKRVDLVIRNAASWPSIDFRIAGKGEEESNCRSLAAELGCNNVTFLGHLSQPEIAEQMRRADVFLFPSILEGHPQVLVQAAACGLPVVAMEKYHPDYVVNGETGYLVGSESELAERLQILLSHHDLRSKMSAAAARHALQFDWDKVTEDWERVFVEAAAKRKRR